MTTQYWDRLVVEFEDFNGSLDSFLKVKGLTKETIEALIPTDIRAMFAENIQLEKEEQHQQFLDEQFEEFIEYSKYEFESLYGFIRRKQIDPYEFVKLLPMEIIDRIISTKNFFFLLYEGTAPMRKLGRALDRASNGELQEKHDDDNREPPDWYDPSLTIRAMAKKAGVSHERIRQLLESRGLARVYELTCPRAVKHCEMLNTILSVPRPWSMPKLTEETGYAETGIRYILKKYNLSLDSRTKIVTLENIDEWYDPTLTVDKMAEKVGSAEQHIFEMLKKLKLPYVRRRGFDKPSWYDPEKTAKEMAEISGTTVSNVSILLRKRNLPFKKNPQYKSKLKGGLSWYSPNLSIREMAEKTGVNKTTVYHFLVRNKLEYVRARTESGSFNHAAKRKFLPKLKDVDWYSEDFTVEEMVRKSGYSTHIIRHLLKRDNMPYRHAIKDDLAKSFLSWYSPSLTLREMAAKSGCSYSAIAKFLRKNKFTFKGERLHLRK